VEEELWIPGVAKALEVSTPYSRLFDVIVIDFLLDILLEPGVVVESIDSCAN